jgi:hypothetical protein
MACDDLRIGGTLSASGISGGVSINNAGIAVMDWSGIFGHVGYSSFAARVAGRPGVTLVGDALPKERYLTLNLAMTQKARTGGPVEPSLGAYLWENTDTVLGYLADPVGFYLEVDDPLSTTRFVFCNAPDPALIDLFREERRTSIPIVCSEPYWKVGGQESTNTGTGAGTITNTGNATVYDAILDFAGAGAYTNSTAGWTLTVSAACVLDLGNRTIQVAGVNSDNLLTGRTDQAWGWFLPGANTITRSATVTTTFRSQYN